LDDGAHLSGKVQEPILGREAKRETLISLAAKGAIPLTETMALGDGANDLAMVETAGLGIAYKAKPVLEEKAAAAIRYSDLTAALYFQGYRAAEFAAA
ncbi:MAG TPA: HAD hydrolase family protein, partial [Micropepsaceae bacterium]|nr:HAD hydrolase family protein [Micropepsaceae bacterium]